MNKLDLKKIRAENGNMTQTDMANRLGINLRTIQNYEKGKTIPLYIKKLIKYEFFSYIHNQENKIVDPSQIKTTRCDTCLERERAIQFQKKQLEAMETCLFDREKQLKTFERMISEKDKQIEDLKSNMALVISEKSEVVKMKDEMLSMKDDAIKGREAMLAMKDEMLEMQAEKIAELEDFKKMQEKQTFKQNRACPSCEDQGS